jgi:hypothetical protein
MAASFKKDWQFHVGNTNELDRVVEIETLTVRRRKLQVLLNETRTSHRQDGMSFDYPILMGYERTVVEKELATIKVNLMLLGAKT